MLLQEEREAVVRVCRLMASEGLVVGTAGNISVRKGELIAITPSGLSYDALTPELVSVCELDGTLVDSPLKPTSELPMHSAAYLQSMPGAVVHTHSVAATALSCLVDEVPPVHYYLGLFGGSVRVAPYALYGSPELAENMCVAMTERTACLLANHGAVVLGGSLDDAYERAKYLEWLCDVALRVQSAGLLPRVLGEERMAEAVDRLSTYGQKAPER
ncbi:class II aldolase/adducin family protein [Allokutzneria multivorans]|uniref:Class II aldolase/adducin family protein n=1 Tax=Allokutzneria multivorans TaxID=1142134 RepID=A0ABP7RCU7_9PSEU